MTKKLNKSILQELMEEHELTRREVAEILKVHVTTVDRWLTPAIIDGEPNPTHRRISDGQLEHLKLALKERAA